MFNKPAVNIIKTVILLIICSFLTSCSVFTSPRVWRQTGPEVPELSVFDKTMKDFMVSRKVSAGSLAITYNSRLVFARGYTWSKADSPATEPMALFRIASLSKPITSAGILKLAEDKRLSLDDKVMEILSFGTPEGETPDPNLKKVTILHLLEHLGGWDRDKTFDPMFADEKISKTLGVPMPVSQADIITFMNGRPLQYEPGTKFAYSNYGYCLLGRVIEQITGMSYEDYIKRFVLSPLGITRMQIGHSNLDDRVPGEVAYESKKESAYGSFNLENMDSHGGWLLSAPELVRFAAAFDDPANCPILSAASIETMFSLPATIARENYKPGEKYYACGWDVRDYGNGRRNTWHTGSLPGCYTFMSRWSNGVNCVVLFNKRGDGFEVIDPLLWKAVKSVSNWPEHDLFDGML
ncbi:MAG: beta-lactamase family protein [Sedimentisphaerales bacterium]|nr:beta-lactamase family protein [Sedimentisphaerales bacterium]